jgi:hypothetical protein
MRRKTKFSSSRGTGSRRFCPPPPRRSTPLVFLVGAAGTHFIPILGAVHRVSLVWAAGLTSRCARKYRYACNSPVARHVRDKQQPSRRCWSGEPIFAFAPWGVTESQDASEEAVRNTSSVKVSRSSSRECRFLRFLSSDATQVLWLQSRV